MEEIYHSLTSPEIFILIEGSIKKRGLIGQMFYLFIDHEDIDRYNKDPYQIKESFFDSTKEGIANITDSHKKCFIDKILNNEFNTDILTHRFIETDFEKKEIKNFLPYNFDNSTLDFFIGILTSKILIGRFKAAKGYPSNKGERGELLP